MVLVPAEAQIEFTLVKGNVYFISDPAFNTETPHFFVILNANPRTDEFVVLVNATSQVEKRRARAELIGAPETTIVEVSDADYRHFTKPTVFDCNYPCEKTKEDLIQLLQATKLGPFQDPMPAGIVKQLCQGVLDSRIVEKRIKDLIASV